MSAAKVKAQKIIDNNGVGMSCAPPLLCHHSVTPTSRAVTDILVS